MRAGDATAAAIGRRACTDRGATHADAVDGTHAAETVKAGAMAVGERVDGGETATTGTCAPTQAAAGTQP